MWKSLIKNYPHPIFVLCGIVLGIIAKLVFSAEPYAHYIWFITLLLGGAPVVYKTIKGMLKKEFASDIVAMLAIVTAIIMDQAFAGALVVLMQSGGEAIEEYGLKRASSSLDTLLARAPQFAFRKAGEALEKIPVTEVKIGDILIVRPGDLIPVDGALVEGTAEIDESAVTGEPFLRTKKRGDKVLSGCIDVNGAFEMRAERVSAESQYAKIVQLVKRAQEEKAPIQRLADRYAIYFTPLTLLMSVIGYFITKDPHTILSVLVVATPCPLILATPVAVISGLNRAAEAGIIVKGGAAIEQIGKAEMVVFDKTGTITHGAPRIEKILSFSGMNEKDLLYKIASVEQLSTHSVAQAIAKQGLEEFKTLPLPTNFRESPGKGVEAHLNGESIFIGSKKYVEEQIGSAVFDASKATLEEIQQTGSLLVCIGINQTLVGVVTLTDQVRDGAAEMVGHLHALGVKHMMVLTGDSQKNAETVCASIGIKDNKAHLLPEEKVSAIKHLKTLYRCVVMVGDGINDAPALATATVGVAMGAHGTAISAEAADIVLLVDDIDKVSEAVSIGQRMLRIARQSIFVGMGLSFCLMIIAALGFIPPAIGALLQEVIDVVVILNALRAR